MKHWSDLIGYLRGWWQSPRRTTHLIVSGLVIAASLLAIPVAVNDGDWSGVWLNLGTELAGGAVTFVVLEQVLGTRQRKEDLIAQMKSRVNAEAVRAVEKMRLHPWIQDGSLRGEDLSGAVLSKANLQGADLSDANLNGTKLKGAILMDANLQNTRLRYANLRKADLRFAALVNADLFRADLSLVSASGANFRDAQLLGVTLDRTTLSDARLSKTNFRGAKFIGNVSLEGSDLTEAIFSPNFHPKGTLLLPDGTTWTEETDMGRFTDPDHPNYWREKENDFSPAYEGYLQQLERQKSRES